MQSTAQQSRCVNTICGRHRKHGDKEGSTCDLQFAASRELTFHDTVVHNSREDDKWFNHIIFRPAKRQFSGKLRTGRMYRERRFGCGGGEDVLHGNKLKRCFDWRTCSACGSKVGLLSGGVRAGGEMSWIGSWPKAKAEEKVQRAPRLVCGRASTNGEEGGECEEEKDGATVMLEEFVSKQQYKGAEEMTQWRNISKEGMAALMKVSCGNMEEEVLEKYNVKVVASR